MDVAFSATVGGFGYSATASSKTSTTSAASFKKATQMSAAKMYTMGTMLPNKGKTV